MSIVFKVMKVMPIDRSSAGNMVTQVAEEFSKRDKFFPVVFPEGTRKDVKNIKTGFWHIADQAKVPIVFLYKDGQKKQLLILGHMFTGKSKEDDLIKNQGYLPGSRV